MSGVTFHFLLKSDLTIHFQIFFQDLDMVKENILHNKLEELFQADQLRQQIYRLIIIMSISFPLLFIYCEGFFLGTF